MRQRLARAWGAGLALALALAAPAALHAQETASAEAELPLVEIPTSRSLSLEQALKLGMEGSPDLKLVEEKLVQAQILRDRALAVLIPSASFRSIYTIYNEEVAFPQGGIGVGQLVTQDGAATILPFDGSSAPQGPLVLTPGEPVTVTVQPQFQWRNQLTLQTVLDARTLPLLETAKNLEQVSILGRQQLRIELQYGAALLYLQMLSLKELMGIADSSLQIRQELLRAAESRKEKGVGTDFEVTQAKLEVLKARKEINALRLTYLKVREGLALLISTDPNFEVEALPALPSDLPDEAEALDQALQGSPGLKVSQKSIEVSESTLSTSKWAYAPNLVTQFNLTQQPETLFGPGFQWNLQFILAWELYDGGGREAAIAENESKLRESRLELEKAERKLKADMRQAFLEVRTHGQQIQVLERQIALAEQGLRQAQDGYALGAVPQLEVFNAEQQLKIARTQLSQERLALYIAMSDLYRLRGQALVP